MPGEVQGSPVGRDVAMVIATFTMWKKQISLAVIFG